MGEFKAEISEDVKNRKNDGLTGMIIGAAIDVHRALGPGLLESAYVTCLAYELSIRKLKIEREKVLPVQQFPLAHKNNRMSRIGRIIKIKLCSFRRKIIKICSILPILPILFLLF